jgi:DNA-binding response OmpR family regulator
MGKILLVDDHPDIVRLLQMSLRGEGHAIFVAHDGEEALEQLRKEQPDMVFLDVIMPKLDGFRVLNRIKSDPELRNTVVVMLTVRDQPEDVTLGLDVGAEFYMTKPFRPDEVVALARRVFLNRERDDLAAGERK